MIGQLRFGALSRAGAIGIVAMLLTAVIVDRLQAASAPSLAQLIEGAKKEDTLRGQWSQNSFGGAKGLSLFLVEAGDDGFGARGRNEQKIRAQFEGAIYARSGHAKTDVEARPGGGGRAAR